MKEDNISEIKDIVNKFSISKIKDMANYGYNIYKKYFTKDSIHKIVLEYL